MVVVLTSYKIYPRCLFVCEGVGTCCLCMFASMVLIVDTNNSCQLKLYLCPHMSLAPEYPCTKSSQDPIKTQALNGSCKNIGSFARSERYITTKMLASEAYRQRLIKLYRVRHCYFDLPSLYRRVVGMLIHRFPSFYPTSTIHLPSKSLYFAIIPQHHHHT